MVIVLNKFLLSNNIDSAFVSTITKNYYTDLFWRGQGKPEKSDLQVCSIGGVAKDVSSVC